MTGAPSILLVDDHPENLLALEAILEPLGVDCVRATSGFEALRKLLRRDFAAILLDVSMPDMDGFETAAIIKRRRRSQEPFAHPGHRALHSVQNVPAHADRLGRPARHVIRGLLNRRSHHHFQIQMVNLPTSDTVV